MARYISEMNQNVIVILKRWGETWSRIQSKLQNKYSTTVSKHSMQKIWQKFIKTKEDPKSYQ